MPIIRVSKDKKNPYFVMNKSGINDPDLSLKAKGLLSYLISKPDHWYVNYNDIIKHSKNSVYSVRSAVAELLSHGYMKRTQLRKSDGQFGYYDYIVYEKPLLINIRKNRLSPHSGFPHTVPPLTDNFTLLSNDLENVMSTTTTPAAKNLKSPALAVVDPAALEMKKETILLLDKLKIKNYKKIFKEFPLDKIFDYSRWITNRKSKMSNPTGFLISAIRENWLDYEKTPEKERLPRFWVYCFPCRKNYNYQSKEKIPYICPICKKSIPFSEHEKI